MLSGGYATLPFGICTERLSVVADPDGRKTNVGMDPAVPCEPTERKALKIIPAGQLCCVNNNKCTSSSSSGNSVVVVVWCGSL